MTALPTGWKRTTMGEIGKYLNGKAFKSQDWKSSGRPIIRIQNLTGSGTEFNYFQGEVEERYEVQPGDLLFSWSATLGTYIWKGPEAVLNQHIFKVESNIDKSFHRYLLDFKIQEMHSQTHGSGMVHITKKSFDSIEVNIPSIDEQHKIVELLEEHLSRLDAALADVKQAKLKAAQFRRSLLQFAFRRRFVDEQEKSNWTTTQLSDLADIGWGDLQVTKKSYVDSGYVAYSATGADGFLPYFDYDSEGIIVSAIGANCGRIFKASGKWSCIKNTMRILPNNSSILIDYLFHYLSDSTIFPKRGSGQPFIGQQDAREIEISFPSVAEQQKIIDFVEYSFSRLDSSMKLAEQMEIQALDLRRSLLHAAFTGQLTKKEVVNV